MTLGIPFIGYMNSESIGQLGTGEDAITLRDLRNAAEQTVSPVCLRRGDLWVRRATWT